MLALLLAVLGVFAVILIGSLQIADIEMRQLFVGFLSCASLVSMFASPLFIIVSMSFPTYPYNVELYLLANSLDEITYFTFMCFSEIGHSDKEC